MNSISIEIITGLVSLIIGVIVAITTKSKDSKVNWGITLSSIVFTLLIGSHLNSRIEANKIHSLLDFYVKFRDNPDAVNLARKQSEAKNKLADGCVFLKTIFNEKKQRFNNSLETLGNASVFYNITNLSELGEMQNDAVKIFELADKNTRIRATSYVNVDQWWNNEFGKQYSEANKKARERGVEIERVWIIKDKNELKASSLKNSLENEKKMNIKSYYVLEKDIQDFDEDKIDIIIVTNKKDGKSSFYGELNLTLFRKMTSVTFAADFKRLSELESYWTELMKIAEEY